MHHTELYVADNDKVRGPRSHLALAHPGIIMYPPLYLSSGAAAAALPVPTDFWLFITLLKSKICVKVVHPFIILSISVQSVLLPSVLNGTDIL